MDKFFLARDKVSEHEFAKSYNFINDLGRKKKIDIKNKKNDDEEEEQEEENESVTSSKNSNPEKFIGKKTKRS